MIDGVQEVFCGDLEGRTDHPSREAFEHVYQAWLRGELEAHLPGGESALDLRARFLPAVDAVTAGARDTVVVVSHGAAIRLAVGAMLGESAETRYVPNAGIVVLTGAAGRWTLGALGPGRAGRGRRHRRRGRDRLVSPARLHDHRLGARSGQIRPDTRRSSDHGPGGGGQPQPSSCRVSSSMPKWCAISWTTVTATSCTTSSRSAQTSTIASW